MAEIMSTGHVNAECKGGIQAAYANGVIGIYGGGPIPTDLDQAITATLLATISLDGGEFTPGVATNGLNFGDPVNGVMSKSSSEVWSGVGNANAGSTGVTATFYVHYANDMTTGASTTAVRMAGVISTSPTAEMPMTDPVIKENTPIVIANYNYIPKKS